MKVFDMKDENIKTDESQQKSKYHGAFLLNDRLDIIFKAFSEARFPDSEEGETFRGLTEYQYEQRISLIKDLHFELIENFATCRSGQINVEGYFTQALNLPRLEQFWRIFAETDYDSDLGILTAKLDDVNIVISANGSMIGKGNEIGPVFKLMKKLVLEIYRSEECTECKVCLVHCKSKAITIDPEINQVVIDQNLCEKSKQCHYHCPVIKYGHKEIDDLFDENIEILDQDRSRIAHY